MITAFCAALGELIERKSFDYMTPTLHGHATAGLLFRAKHSALTIHAFNFV